MLEILGYIVVGYLINMMLCGLTIEIVNSCTSIQIRIFDITIGEFYFKFMFLPVLLYKIIWNPDDLQ